MDRSREMWPGGRNEGNSCPQRTHDCLPLQMVDFVCVLSLLSFFLVRLIFKHLHSFASTCLILTGLSHRVQLADLVLEKKRGEEEQVKLRGKERMTGAIRSCVSFPNHKQTSIFFSRVILQLINFSLKWGLAFFF